MIMQFVFDDELLDDMYVAQDEGNKDVRDIVAKRMKEVWKQQTKVISFRSRR